MALEYYNEETLPEIADIVEAAFGYDCDINELAQDQGGCYTMNRTWLSTELLVHVAALAYERGLEDGS